MKFGRIIHYDQFGNGASGPQKLSQDPHREFVFVFKYEDGIPLTNMSGRDILHETGHPDEFIDQYRDHIWEVVTFDEGNVIPIPATWRHITEHADKIWAPKKVSVKGGGTLLELRASKYFKPARQLLENMPFDVLEGTIFYGNITPSFHSIKNGTARLPVWFRVPRTLKDFCEGFEIERALRDAGRPKRFRLISYIRLFFYLNLNMNEMFSGNGWSYNLDGHASMKEYIVPNMMLDSIETLDRTQIKLDLSTPLPSRSKHTMSTENGITISLPIRLRHQIDSDHLIRAIGSLDDTQRDALIGLILANFPDSMKATIELEVDDFDNTFNNNVEWYNRLDDDDKREFLSEVGVRVENLSPVKMTKSFPVNDRTSSAIARIGYNPDECRLEITFQTENGRAVHQYAFVPPRVFEEFISAQSIGRFYTMNIRNVYQTINV
jgi:hypothetical protein